jgi:hypothetical protein
MRTFISQDLEPRRQGPSSTSRQGISKNEHLKAILKDWTMLITVSLSYQVPKIQAGYTLRNKMRSFKEKFIDFILRSFPSTILELHKYSCNNNRFIFVCCYGISKTKQRKPLISNCDKTSQPQH